jgi:hypothetical protein
VFEKGRFAYVSVGGGQPSADTAEKLAAALAGRM